MLNTYTSLIFAFVLGTSGLKIAYSNLDLILTSPVDINESVNNFEPRIPGIPDVIVLNNRDKIVMTDHLQNNQKCWLPDQVLFNSNCKSNIDIDEIPDSVFLDLKYEDVVNMKDRTGLHQHEFSDKYDLGQTKFNKGKKVNFSDKFGDLGPVDESETWERSENEFKVPKKKFIITRNNN